MPDFTGDLGNKITEAVHDAIAVIPGIEAPLLQTIKDSVSQAIAAEVAAIPVLGDMEMRVVDHIIDRVTAMLNSQRAALGAEMDQRFLAIGQALIASAGTKSTVQAGKTA